MAGTRRPRVCHVVSTSAGARWMAEQLRCLRDHHGWDVTAVVSGAEGPLIDLLRDEGIPYHVEPGFCFLDSASSVLRIPALVWRLARYFRANRFDVVQSHLLFATLPTRFAAWLAGTPARLTMYPSPYHLDVPKTRWMDRLSWWMESRLVASCQYTYDLIRQHGVDPQRLALIYYGVDAHRYDPANIAPIDLASEFGWPAATPVIAKVAYFYPRQPAGDWTPEVVRGKNTKAFEDLIDAMPMVLAAFPDAKLLLVGGAWGEAGLVYQEEMKDRVRQKNLGESVIFTGFRTDVNRILCSADVTVQAAIYENVGGVVESLLMARPTVATAVGGMVDCVVDGKTGVLTRSSDPADLARGINSLLANPAQAAVLGANGRRLMLERFTLQRTGSDLDALYRELLSQRTRQSPYGITATLLRSLVGLPLLAWFILRVAYRDFYLPAHWPTHRNRVQDILAMPFLFDLYLARLYAKRRGQEAEDSASRLPPRIRWANRKITARHLLRKWAVEIPLHGRVAVNRVASFVRWKVVAPLTLSRLVLSRATRFVLWRVLQIGRWRALIRRICLQGRRS